MMLGDEQPSALLSEQLRSQNNETEERGPPSKFKVVSIRPKKLLDKHPNHR